MEDILKRHWNDQKEFMKLLQEKRNFPSWPVNIKTKQGQKTIKEVIQDSQTELFEALQHLKNTKSHRLTENTEVDLDAYTEECVDAIKYIFEAMLLAGVTFEQYVEIFDNKTIKNTKRINGNY